MEIQVCCAGLNESTPQQLRTLNRFIESLKSESKSKVALVEALDPVGILVVSLGFVGTDTPVQVWAAILEARKVGNTVLYIYPDGALTHDAPWLPDRVN
jgi:hypothetical protein